MQSKAATVSQYLSELPPERRAAIEAVRKVIRANVDKDIEEGMQYGMIGYYVPHRVFPAGYHCDPKQPLPYGGLASQKNAMSLYLMCIYMDGPHKQWFVKAWKATGKKLDMGAACIRFKRVEDLALDVIAEAIRRVPSAKYVEVYQSLRKGGGGAKASKPAAKKNASKGAKRTVGKTK